MSKRWKRSLLCSIPVLVLGLADGAFAQTAPAAEAASDGGGDIIVTGARGRPRTVIDSPVPVDAFNAQDLEGVPNTDTIEVLTTLIPSFTVSRNSNSDGSTAVRTPSLRGLPGNKTLMLLNSRRRHRTASMPNGGFGSQGADAALIPQLALRSVEVLRDGAAAQYGSDAIAGVINFILKDSPSGGGLTAQAGQYYEGDGFDYSIAGNIGLPLGDRGFLNITAEHADMEQTHRGTQFTNSAFDPYAYAAEHPEYAAAVDLSEPLQRTGQPDLEAFRSVFNAGYDLGAVDLYAFGTYAATRTLTHGGYRWPGNGQAVNDNPIRLEDGAEFRFNEIFPGGWRPLYTGVIDDYALNFGGRFEIGAISYDLGVGYGRDEFGFELEAVPNPSLGPDTPTSFRPGTWASEELALNLDAVSEIPIGAFASPLALNFGAEYRHETFDIEAGDPDSYAVGPWGQPDPFGFCDADHNPTPAAPVGVGLNCANYLAGAADGYAGIDPVYTVLDAGSAGIPGTGPDYAGSFGRESYSLYLEGTADVTNRLFVDLAGRYEDYSDFGERFSGKVALLYRLTDEINLRGSFGTGFRAPSTGQLYLANVRVTFIDGDASQVGTFPATHPASSFLGATPLRPETSESLSLGLTVSTPFGLTFTADAYQIEIDDTIYMTSLIAVTPEIRAELVAANVPGAASLTSMRFYQNAFNSTTSGVDLVASYRADWESGSSTSFSLAFNYNKYEVNDVRIANLFNDVTIRNFEQSNPDWRASATARHEIGDFTALGRLNFFGPYSYQRTTAPFGIQDYEVEVLLDLELSYEFENGVDIALGARNVTDNYPDRDDIGSVTNGMIYRDGPMSFQGGYYYLRTRKTF